MKSKHLQELVKLAKQHGGEVTPAQVVDRARDPDNVLHSWFDWNDTEAAEKWRLEQARRLLRVVVTVLPHPDGGKSMSVRAFFSPMADADDCDGPVQHEPRPYQATVTMMQSKDGRAAILATALDEFERFKRKYEFLKELTVLFKSAEYLREYKKQVSP